MDVKAKQVDVIPLVNHYINEMGLHEIFDRYIPNTNGADIKPAQVLCTMISNIMVATKPLYKIEEWLTDYTDGKAEEQVLAKKYNDDRCGREADRLYNADRHSILLEAVASAIRIHDLEIKGVHNDSTSVTFSGAYENQSPHAVQLENGYNKDYRPDLKQIVFGLNITEDGHVPIGYHVYNGSTADIGTHQTNWNSLREFLVEDEFIYIADCKLYSQDNLHHIHSHGGHFITLVPKNIKAIKQFIKRVKEGEIIAWGNVYPIESSRKKGKENIYRTYDNEVSADGYRIIWVHSSRKESMDKRTRQRQLKNAEQALESLVERLNKYYLKTPEQIAKAVKKICSSTGQQLMVEIKEKETIETKQIGRGRAGTETKYEAVKTITYELHWHRNKEVIEQESRADGLFPLITNNKQMVATDVLKHYKKQPFIEKRFQTKKSTLDVAPVFLHKNERIEAILFLYFIALMLVSLIERNIRQQMSEQNIDSLPIRPTGLRCKSPTWDNIRYFFRSIYLAIIVDGKDIIKTQLKGITPLHKKLLRLLKVPLSIYENLKDYWWEFEFSTG
ncbi:MAG: IS1634 family transposase [Mariprofundaceae bacterium]|nr:IS1634 family transposase [Mariprofundaceae bacterium]